MLPVTEQAEMFQRIRKAYKDTPYIRGQELSPEKCTPEFMERICKAGRLDLNLEFLDPQRESPFVAILPWPTNSTSNRTSGGAYLTQGMFITKQNITDWMSTPRAELDALHRRVFVSGYDNRRVFLQEMMVFIVTRRLLQKKRPS